MLLINKKIEKLKNILNKNNVLISEEERYSYSQDASNLIKSTHIPDLVVFVETVEEVQKIVKYANTHNIPIISRGAGTNMVGACVSTETGIVLNFSKMNKIIELNPINMTATVQPGVILGDLKKAVNELNLFYPPDPSNYKVSTVGGSIAQSSGGAYSFKYGTTKDYVLSLKVVTADGSLITVGTNTTKNSVGYHLAQLMVGSEGTLGIIIEATLKLVPKPETRTVIAAYFNNTASAIDTVSAITSSGIYPAAIDYMDKNSIATVEDFAKLGLKTNMDNLILIELDGYKSSMQQQVQSTTEILKNKSANEIIISKSEEECEKLWQARRASFAATTRLAPDVVSDDIIVPRENLTKMIEACNEITKKYSLKMCLIGHIGDGNIHPQIALNLENEEEFKNLMSAKAEMYTLAISLGGSISGEHGIGLEKLSYFENTIDKNVLQYMKFIKKSFDPKNILNPGKIFSKE